MWRIRCFRKLEPVAHFHRHGGRNDRHRRILSTNPVMEVIHAETDALKEKLEMEIHRFARPPEELSSGDPYFEQLQTMLAIRDELENIPLCDIQRNMLLAMENVLESAWSFRNTPSRIAA